MIQKIKKKVIYLRNLFNAKKRKITINLHYKAVI